MEITLEMKMETKISNGLGTVVWDEEMFSKYKDCETGRK